MHRCRKLFKLWYEQREAAVSIQTMWRMYANRKATLALLHQKRLEDAEKFAAIQQQFCQQWSQIKTRRRYAVYYGSIGHMLQSGYTSSLVVL